MLKGRQNMNNNYFAPGEIWRDINGKPIQAHGGGILYHNGRYYWYGEDKNGPTISGDKIGCGYRVDLIGIGCYSSTDLLMWKDEGLVLPAVKEDPSHDLFPDKVAERPKVLFNELTGMFVMWLHIDDKAYLSARVGIAVSETPTGPFKYLKSIKPNGNDGRDMTLFKDTDGKAYIIYSSEWNRTLCFEELTPDYQDVTGNYVKRFRGCYREAPAIFQHDGRYYLITSGCTGWNPNKAEYAVADSIMTKWEVKGNPCVGPDAENTFYAQSTFVINVKNRNDKYIAMFDKWIKEDLKNSRYIWLPIKFNKGDTISIQWRDKWDLSIFEKTDYNR
jgi:beta-galactosidase